MSFLESWVATPLAAALGWTPVHSLWEGGLAAAGLAAALGILRSPRARYAVALAALAVMLGGFLCTLALLLPAGAGHARVAGPLVFPAWGAGAGGDGSGPGNPNLAAAVPWLAPVWMAGVWIFCLAHLAGWFSARRLRRHGVCCAPARWQQEAARWSARLRISRPVLLLESCLAEAPAVVGHFRPVILVPVGLLAGLPAQQVEAILLHELAHIRRCDYLVNLFQRLGEGLLFYHPAAWWISRVIRSEREHCCDDAVVDMSGNAPAYAAALATLEQNRCSGRVPAVAATGGSLVKRIRRLLYPNAPAGGAAPWFAAAALLATAAVALAAWQGAPARPGSAAPQKAGRAASPYAQWLSRDVVYIIADEERAAFLRLKTDAERDKFIEQFWLRRDPTPGTPKNEFKDEHYRRIASANQRFRTASGTPGWQTDRGHMYIVYGPPDEIEDHPAGAQSPYANEIWMYHHVEGLGDRLFFTFVDRTGRGDYRLAPGNVR